MSVKSRWVNGNLVFIDGARRQRWIDAIGPDVCKLKEEFVGTAFTSADNLAGWTTTLVEAGGGETTVALTDAVGGHLLITTDNTASDGANLQVTKEAFKLASGKPLYFGTRLKVADATACHILTGLAITDTALIPARTDSACFIKDGTAATLNFQLEKDSTATSGTAHTMVDDTFVVLEFFFDGTNVDFYVDGTLKTRLATTNLPDNEELTPSLHFRAAGNAITTCTVDWIRCLQINA